MLRMTEEYVQEDSADEHTAPAAPEHKMSGREK